MCTRDPRAARNLARLTRLAGPALVLGLASLSGCREIGDGIAAAVDYLITLIALGAALSLVGILGLVGLSTSSGPPTRTRLVLATPLALAGAAGGVLTLLWFRGPAPLLLLLALLSSPAVFWALLTYADALGARAAPPSATPPYAPYAPYPPYPPNPPFPPPSPRRAGGAGTTVAVLLSVAYVASLGAIAWVRAGKPSWSQMFPPPKTPRATGARGDGIAEIRSDVRTVGRTEKGTLLVFESDVAVPLPGTFVDLVASDATVCGLAEDASAKCFGVRPGDPAPTIPGHVRSLALSSRHACWLSREGAIACQALAGAERAGSGGVVEVRGGEGAVELALDGGTLFARTEAGVVASFDASDGKKLESTYDDVRAVASSGSRLCLLGKLGTVRCARGREIRAIELPTPAVAIAITTYTGCAIDAAGALACWDEFSRATKASPVAVAGKVVALYPSGSFKVGAKLGVDRFVEIDGEGKITNVALPTTLGDERR